MTCDNQNICGGDSNNGGGAVVNTSGEAGGEGADRGVGDGGHGGGGGGIRSGSATMCAGGRVGGGGGDRPKLNNTCSKCNVKLLKYRPNLFCSICTTVKHYRCQGLSKAEAQYIFNSTANNWICKECIVEVLPVGACANARTAKRLTTPSYKAKCQCCGGMSYNEKNTKSCPWCLEICHIRCVNNSLGCDKCCEQMIPGFRVNSYEITGDYHHKNSAIFNPYSNQHHTNILGDQISREQDNDSLWNEISDSLMNCEYKQPKNIKFPKENELNIFSLNIRSLNKNLNAIQDNVSEYQKYDILSFNETNCNTDKLANGLDDLLIEGFHPPTVQSPARSTDRGGGLAIYVNKRVCSADDIKTIDLNFESPPTDGEFLFIKISSCKNVKKTVIVGNVYRSPSRKREKFNELFDCVLQKLDRHRDKQILLVGDFNSDLIQYECDTAGQALVDTTSNRGFIQVISRPTRITDHSATLIDHIYTNKIENLVSASILTIDLSDHLATYAIISLDGDIKFNKMNQNNCDGAGFRLHNATNDEKFSQLMKDENWDIPDGLDAQVQHEHFMDIYIKHYNTAYPLITKRERRKNERLLPKQWILPWLEDACARKNRLYHTYVKNPTVKNKAKYNKMRNFVNKHTKIAKDKYHKNYFEQYKENSKKQWQMINSLLNRKNKKSGPIKLQDGEGTSISNPNLVAEKFNDYFANIASNLKSNNEENVQYNRNEFQNFMPSPVQNSMFTRPVDSSEVYDIIKNMKNKATLDTKVNPLKIANSDFKFTNTLAKIITSSFQDGIFPQPLKLARVVPIFKSGSKSDVSNYRPISLLDSFSKIYEKLMHNRVVEFMESNQSFHELQYGFRSGRSCEHALLAAQNQILHSLNKQQISLLLLIDFSKAFDMVEHPILLKKLENYGIRGTTLKWFESYLCDREQFVTVNGVDSAKSGIKYGVPQGSILGPLLFVIYINDLPNICQLAKFILYADDANIIIRGNSIQEIEQQLSELIPALTKWVDKNGLKLNLKKTNYMVFSKQKINNMRDIFISSTKIERKSECRFLGVIVDDKLCWAQHITAMKAKMSRYVGIMYRIKSLLPVKARLQIFHSFVQSHLNFCPLVWGFAAKSNIEALFTSQKKGLRAAIPGHINYMYRDGALPTHTKSFFDKFNILTVHGIVAINTLTFIHKVQNLPQTLPMSVRDTIPSDAPTHGSDHEMCGEWLKTYGSNSFSKSVFFKGPLLSMDQKFVELITPATKQSYKLYRNNAKKLLLKLQNQGDTDEWQADNFVLYNVAGLRKSNRTKPN